MKKTKNKKSRVCGNCRQILDPATDNYCPDCGQKNLPRRISLGNLISEAFSVIFNLDNKFFRTTGAIFIPGRLTKDFFSGKRQRYVHPMRLLLVSIFLLIFSLNYYVGKVAEGNISGNEIIDGEKATAVRAEDYRRLDTVRLQVLQEIDPQDTVAAAAVDTFYTRFVRREPVEDSIRFGGGNVFGRSSEVVMARKDYLELTGEEIVDKYGITDRVERLIWRQAIRLTKRTDRLLSYLFGNILWLVLFTLPLYALVLKLFYIRRNFYYIEHLVFTMHLQSFIFFGIAVVLPFSETETALSMSLLALFHAIYVFFAVLFFYKQSVRKTLLKFLLLNAAYWMLVIFTMTVTALLSLALF